MWGGSFSNTVSQVSSAIIGYLYPGEEHFAAAHACPRKERKRIVCLFVILAQKILGQWEVGTGNFLSGKGLALSVLIFDMVEMLISVHTPNLEIPV